MLDLLILSSNTCKHMQLWLHRLSEVNRLRVRVARNVGNSQLTQAWSRIFDTEGLHHGMA